MGELLTRALILPNKNSAPNDVSDDEIELALALICGKINRFQAAYALGIRNYNNNVIVWTFKTINAAIEKNKIDIKRC